MIHTLLALSILAATPSGMAPLPTQYLQASMFNSPDGWFSLHSPDGSEWFEMRRFDGDADPRWPDDAHHVVAWYMRNPKMHSLLVMERYAVGAPMLDADYIHDIEKGVRQAGEPGDTFSEFSAALITQPVEGIRYSYRKTSRDGSISYRFWYATGWEHKVFMEASAPTNEEPKWLREIAQSFRWLKTP